MRNRRALVLTAFIITWSFITYYFILRSANNNSNHSSSNPFKKNDIPQMKEDLHQQFRNLDYEVRKEHEKSKNLFKGMINILKSKYDDRLKINEMNQEKPNGIPEPPKQLDQRQQNQQPLEPLELKSQYEEKPLPFPLPLPSKGTLNENENGNENANEQLDDSSLTTSPTNLNILPRQTHLANGEPVIPILVFACNRITIRKCLDNLIQYRKSKEQFPIIVSQDCRDEPTKQTILSFKDELHLIEQPDQSDIIVPPKEKKFKGYYKIARHYGWALNTTFQNGYDFVVIVEDDLNVAPDFFEYFLGTYKLLQQDPSLWCVSAWNDNGKENFVDASHPELLYRTDFFPGLGWMLTRQLWAELSVKWPKSFWDDWIRHPAQRKDRVCIRPELSRTKTFGKIGVSNGLFFDKYLKFMKLSTDFVPFTKMNLTYLLKDNYDKTYLKEIYTYPVVTYDELRRNLITVQGPVRIQYSTREQYKRTTKMLGLMDDLKSGVPRTAYHGIVTFFYNKRRVYLAPNANWKGYDLTWS